MPFNASTKKLIIIISILIALIVGVYLIYAFYFKQGTGTSNEKEITIGPKKTQRLFPLSQEKALSPTINSSGDKVRYYSKANGNIYEVNFDGTGLTKISTSNLAGLLNILWSPDKEKVIGFFQKDDKVQKYLHNYQAGQSTLLNENIGQVAWSPDGKQIVLQTYDETAQTNTIGISDADGSNLKNIFQTRIKDLVLEWPTIDKISIRTKTSGLSDGLAIVINPNNGEFYKILNGVFGLNIKWSHLGNLLLYSSTSIEGKNPNLYMTDQTGQTKQALGISSIVEKCVFSQDNRTLFCAVPQKISENAVWPDDYYKGMTTTSDNFYKINLEIGSKETIFQPGENDKSYDASDLFLSPKEDYLFFTNKKDGMLYSLGLE